MTLQKTRFVSGNREQLAWILQVGCSFFFGVNLSGAAWGK